VMCVKQERGWLPFILLTHWRSTGAAAFALISECAEEPRHDGRRCDTAFGFTQFLLVIEQRPEVG
jgi:hypothetical protein